MDLIDVVYWFSLAVVGVIVLYLGILDQLLNLGKTGSDKGFSLIGVAAIFATVAMLTEWQLSLGGMLFWGLLGFCLAFVVILIVTLILNSITENLR